MSNERNNSKSGGKTRAIALAATLETTREELLEARTAAEPAREEAAALGAGPAHAQQAAAQEQREIARVQGTQTAAASAPATGAAGGDNNRGVDLGGMWPQGAQGQSRGDGAGCHRGGGGHVVAGGGR